MLINNIYQLGLTQSHYRSMLGVPSRPRVVVISTYGVETQPASASPPATSSPRVRGLGALLEGRGAVLGADRDGGGGGQVWGRAGTSCHSLVIQSWSWSQKSQLLRHTTAAQARPEREAWPGRSLSVRQERSWKFRKKIEIVKTK